MRLRAREESGIAGLAASCVCASAGVEAAPSCECGCDRRCAWPLADCGTSSSLYSLPSWGMGSMDDIGVLIVTLEALEASGAERH